MSVRGGGAGGERLKAMQALVKSKCDVLRDILEG